MSKITENEVENTWNNFWKDIVQNPDGSINIEQLKKELSDFSKVMDAVPKVYCHVTGGKVSKILTDPDVVCALADEHYEQLHKEELNDDHPQHNGEWIINLAHDISTTLCKIQGVNPQSKDTFGATRHQGLVEEFIKIIRKHAPDVETSNAEGKERKETLRILAKKLMDESMVLSKERHYTVSDEIARIILKSLAKSVLETAQEIKP